MVHLEPKFQPSVGMSNPDLVIVKGINPNLLDAQVTMRSMLDQNHVNRTDKYEMIGILANEVRNRFGATIMDLHNLLQGGMVRKKVD